jgi:glucose-1-phosphate thymidylyltransferase
MKGILLAGGSGTRLKPLTDVVCKQLLPVYNKPMIYYPLSTLLLLGIRDILLISDSENLPRFKKLFGDGKSLGIRLTYEVQLEPNGIAEALIIAETFLNGSNCTLILGDNLLYGPGLGRDLVNKISPEGATILAHHVPNPSQYGVVAFDNFGLPIDLMEKPINPHSNWAVPGLYFYDSSATERAKGLSRSPRGELEITELNRSYLDDSQLKVLKLSRGAAWLDMGNPKLLLEAGNFIQIVEERQGLEVGNPFQVANVMGYLSPNL